MAARPLLPKPICRARPHCDARVRDTNAYLAGTIVLLSVLGVIAKKILVP
jgi:hypothetical protein